MDTPPLSECEAGTRLEPLRPLGTRGRNLDGMALTAVPDSPARGGCADVTICVVRSPAGCLLRVAGELDASASLLLEALLEHIGDEPGDGRVELDLSDVTFADPEGLLSALSSNTMITTASPAVRSTLRSVADTRAAPP